MATVAESISSKKIAGKSIVRFDIHQIVQHLGLMGSFIVLVLTGLPLKFSEAAISRWWVAVLGGIETTRSAHHIAAWVIVIVCVYHLLYIAYTTLILKRPFPIKMVPSRLDYSTFYQEVKYFLGISKERPNYDRFNWREKFDYWAIFWGMPIMAGSGFILMYPVMVTKYLPGWVIPTALVAHSDEAMLALTWIFLVHIFFNHFAPGIFPLNKSIFTGKVPMERYRRDHPMEYKSLLGSDEDEEKS